MEAPFSIESQRNFRTLKTREEIVSRTFFPPVKSQPPIPFCKLLFMSLKGSDQHWTASSGDLTGVYVGNPNGIILDP
jgi:hypothetical protein